MPEADFASWERQTLEQFARACADENKRLREELSLALAAWRKELQRQMQGVPCGTP